MDGVGSSFLTADDVAEILGMSKPYCYKLIRKLNAELEAKGYVTIRGRVERDYFESRMFSFR